MEAFRVSARVEGCAEATFVDQTEAKVGHVPPRPLPEDIWQTSSLQQRTISFPPTLRQHAEVVDHDGNLACPIESWQKCALTQWAA